jgi:hypothetical protein
VTIVKGSSRRCERRDQAEERDEAVSHRTLNRGVAHGVILGVSRPGAIRHVSSRSKN